MARWKVKEGTQVNRDGTVIPAGKSFSATQAEVDAEGLAQYVEKVSEPKAQKKSPNKAQQGSANKAQESGGVKFNR